MLRRLAYSIAQGEPERTSPARLRRYLLLAIICLFAAGIRLYDIAPLSVWFDEGIAINAARQPNLWAVVTADPTNPPVYYLLLHVGIRLFGDSEFALRWCSLMIGLLIVPLGYLLGQAFFNRRAGGLAALLMAFSPPLWWASREVRMYGLLAVLMCVLALAWWRLIKRPTCRAWIVLWVAELALLYTHTTGPIAALWVNIVTPLVWLTQHQLRRPDWRIWYAGQAVLLVCYAPWLIARFVLVPGANQVVAAPPVIGLVLAGQVWQGLWSGAWEMVSHQPLLATLSMALLVWTVLLIPWRIQAARWLTLHVLVLSAGLIAGLIFVRIGLHGRYLVMVVPLLLVVIAGGLAQLRWQTVREDLRWHAANGSRYSAVAASNTLMPAVIVLASIPFFAVSGYSISIAATDPAYQHDGVRDMVDYYAQTLNANDTVLAWSYADRYDLAYYWPRLGVQAKRVTLPEGQDLDVVAPLLPKQGRVALNVWYTQRADQRRMLSCLLTGGNVNPPSVYTVYGMSDELYAAAPSQLPTWTHAEAHFSVADLSGLAALPRQTADQALCLPIRIVTTQTTTHDLKVALVVRNALGWEVARTDALFARADQKTSSQLGPGEMLTAYPLLWLPYGTPPGEYTLVARIYDDSTLSGYDVLSDTGAPAGKDYVLGKWAVQSGADWTRVQRPKTLTPVDIPVGNDLRLSGLSASITSTVQIANGGAIQLALLWQGQAPLPDLHLAADDGSWHVNVPAISGARDDITLDWRQVRVPAEAKAGGATLALPDGRALAHYAITELPGIFTQPGFGTPLKAHLPGIGDMLGYDLSSTSLNRNEPVSVTLVWRAGSDQIAQNYTAFVQLVDQNGKLIAQSDAIPAGGQHPTTSWRQGEYIVDTHILAFRPDAPAGPARLIAGLYDAQTGVRLRFEDGSDAVILNPAINVR
ncbi:MAG TPA: glycosyltransferase family 39 protein [Anaerolineae bacterium]